jgi:hypothetical protein
MKTRPSIDIAITREDDKIKFAIGKYELKLIPTKENTQRYDFLALEQFITRVAKEEYKKIIERDVLEKNLASLVNNDEPPIEEQLVGSL